MIRVASYSVNASARIYDRRTRIRRPLLCHELLRRNNGSERYAAWLKRSAVLILTIIPRDVSERASERKQTRPNKHGNSLLPIVLSRETKNNAGHGTPKETFRGIFHACEKIWMFNSVYGHAVGSLQRTVMELCVFAVNVNLFHVTYMK